MRVKLLTYEDLESFEAVAEIEVTNPGHPERGKVHVTDQGNLEWATSYQRTFEDDARAVAGMLALVLRQGVGTRLLPRDTGRWP